MKDKRKIAVVSSILVILSLIVGGGVFYHFKTVGGLEKELKTVKSEKAFLEKFKRDATTPTPTPEEILAEVNKLRAEVGVAPVVLDEKLNASALLKAQDMVTYNYYAHTNPRTGKDGVDYIFDMNKGKCIYGSEDLARGSAIRDAKGRVQSWKESKPHYEAIINPKHTKMGFAEIFDHSVKVEAPTMAVLHLCQTR